MVVQLTVPATPPATEYWPITTEPASTPAIAARRHDRSWSCCCRRRLHVDRRDRVDAGEGGRADDPLRGAAEHPAVVRRLAADRADAVPVGVELVRGVVVVGGEERPGGGDGRDGAARAEPVREGDDDDVVLADAGRPGDGDRVGVARARRRFLGAVVGDRGIDHVRQRQLRVVEGEREDRRRAAALELPAGALGRDVVAVGVEDRRGRDVQRVTRRGRRGRRRRRRRRCGRGAPCRGATARRGCRAAGRRSGSARRARRRR